MRNGEKYRIWSLTSRGFLVLTPDGENFSVNSNGTGEADEEKSIVTARKHRPSYPGENSFYFVFELADGKHYALHADTENDTVTLKRFTDPKEHAYVSFVPQNYACGPFKALKIGGVDKSLASTKNGTLTLNSLHLECPRPESVFLVMDYDL